MVKTGAFKHTHTQRTHRRLRKERRLIVSTTIFFKLKKKKILPKTFSLFKRGEINWVQYYLSFLNFNLNKVEVCCLSLLCMLGSTCHDTHVEVRGYLWSWCLLLWVPGIIPWSSSLVGGKSLYLWATSPVQSRKVIKKGSNRFQLGYWDKQYKKNKFYKLGRFRHIHISWLFIEIYIYTRK